MLEILLIRHGQTVWNVERRIMGHRPIPLNDFGKRQMVQLEKTLRRVEVDAIYSSPLLRAQQSARLLSRSHKMKVIPDERLIEIEYGDWVGKRFDEVSDSPAYKLYHSEPEKVRVPRGESMSQVRRRAVRFIEALRKNHKEGRVMAVSHADIIKTIVIHYLGLGLNDIHKVRIDNASLSYLWFDGSDCRVLAVNAPAKAGNLFDPRHSRMRYKSYG